MPTTETLPIPNLSPFPWLVRSRNITVLWMVRMMVRLNGFGGLWDRSYASPRHSIFQRLRLPNPSTQDEASLDELSRRLALTLVRMEQNACKYRFGRILERNLALLGKRFSLKKAERMVLALAVLLSTDEELHQIAQSARNQINAAEQIARIVGMSASAVGDALAPKSRLRRSGLVQALGGANPTQNLQLSRGGLRGLALARMASIDDLFEVFLRASPPAHLSDEDYAHLTPNFGFVANLIAEALGCKRPGVNVLLHGPPGTGKTELARTLSKQLGVPLFEVSSIDENGDPLHPRTRLAGAATAGYLLGDRRAILVFDEVDAIFNDGSDFFGKPTTAESAKAWVNNLLEQNQVPTIWIANRIWNMDPAFLRRFDLVIQLGTPPIKQRLRLLERECGSFLDASQLRRFASIDTVTPGIVSRAASVTRRVKATSCPRAEVLEAILDGTLRAQGHPTIRRSCRGAPPADYDITLCNANADLESLAEGLARSKAGRICLYGPPGTGKTAFGYWLANTLNRPLLLKRSSDLQSPFIGVMERNLAKAFEQAAQDHAVLQIDEVDSFLQDRRGDRQNWEVSQVNEFLTQLESFDGIFIASTNLMDGLDMAALRRFDHKIRIDYLRPEQSWRLFCRQLDDWKIDHPDGAGYRAELAGMAMLTPGDFAVVARRHTLTAFADAQEVVAALRMELEFKGVAKRRIGFV